MDDVPSGKLDHNNIARSIMLHSICLRKQRCESRNSQVEGVQVAKLEKKGKMGFIFAV